MDKIKIKVVSCFSGVMMQERGIENTDCFELESVATSEIDIDAIIGAAAIHNGLTPGLVENYEGYPDRQTMANDLIEKNIGYDFVKGKAYDWNKIAKSKDSKELLKKTWLACKLNNNLGDIAKVDKLPKCGLVTFSFPCTDISISGKQSGFDEGQTRSGLVWEVIRILKNMKEENALPNFLLMENVDALVSKKFLPNYEKLNEEFKKLGYDCKWQIINGKNCGVPQNRKRVFGIYYLTDKIDLSKFEFPLPFDKGIRLKDVLEEEVDEKYYLKSDKAQQLIEQLVIDGKVTEEDFL